MISQPLFSIPNEVEKLRLSKFEFFFCGSREMASRFPNADFNLHRDSDWDFAVEDSSEVRAFLNQEGFMIKQKALYANPGMTRNSVDVILYPPEDFFYFKIFWQAITSETYSRFFRNVDRTERIKNYFLLFKLCKDVHRMTPDNLTALIQLKEKQNEVF